jgi:hypothetical protein
MSPASRLMRELFHLRPPSDPSCILSTIVELGDLHHRPSTRTTLRKSIIFTFAYSKCYREWGNWTIGSPPDAAFPESELRRTPHGLHPSFKVHRGISVLHRPSIRCTTRVPIIKTVLPTKPLLIDTALNTQPSRHVCLHTHELALSAVLCTSSTLQPDRVVNPSPRQGHCTLPSPGSPKRAQCKFHNRI